MKGGPEQALITMAKKKGGPKHEQPQPGADQPVTAYRAMGGALTLEEVCCSPVRMSTLCSLLRMAELQESRPLPQMVSVVLGAHTL